MASTPGVPLYDTDRYPQSLKAYLDHCEKDQCTSDFISRTLPDILAKYALYSIFTSCNIDREILAQLHLKHPGVLVDNEVVEPSSQQLQKYRELVSQEPNLDFVNFTWNEMTTTEFEEHWRQKNITKKADFIHMVQVLYYVEDAEATISFFHSLLNKNGKLLIIIGAAGGRFIISKTFQHQLDAKWHPSKTVSPAVIKSLLNARGIPFKTYKLQSRVNVTPCFTEGDGTGELLLDFLTHVQGFSEMASPELRQEVLTVLRGCSVVQNGRVMANDYINAIVINSLD
uniref:Histamine N-methyltransferase n=1 Tax=Periophthalmus magnuspinnatus TaxID=409849 RepID=A0A3B4B492_9GOBI